MSAVDNSGPYIPVRPVFQKSSTAIPALVAADAPARDGDGETETHPSSRQIHLPASPGLRKCAGCPESG
ncbi:hypothetical protein, partial [Plasticicumulans sp.]|uniref:hypothetical protein n=1 Tax=Plasticicumulans sp. TaxID=2307179 RepID=UPI002CA63CFB